jgi:hypothetical protein
MPFIEWKWIQIGNYEKTKGINTIENECILVRIGWIKGEGN